MIRPTQSPASAGAASAVSGSAVASTSPIVGPAGIDAALFAVSAPVGAAAPAAEEVVRFAQALAAVRAGQLVAPAVAPSVVPAEAAGPPVTDAQQAPVVPAKSVSPEHGLFLTPSWLRSRIEVSDATTAGPPAKGDEVRVPAPRRAAVTPALAVFGAPPWLKAPADTPVPLPSVTQAPPVPMGVVPKPGVAATADPVADQVDASGPTSRPVRAGNLPPDLIPATSPLPARPVFSGERDDFRPTSPPGVPGVAPRRAASPSLPAAADRTGTDLPVPPAMMSVVMPAAPRDTEAFTPDPAASVVAGSFSPAGRPRLPMPSIPSLRGGASADPAEPGADGREEVVGSAPSSALPPGRGDGSGRGSAPLETPANGFSLADTAAPSSKGSAFGTHEDADRGSGSLAMEAPPADRPTVDAASAMPFGPAAPERGAQTEVRSIPVDVAAPHWPKAVAAELVMLGHQKVESATLRLSPEHLGHIEVHIHLDAKVINLTFGAAHAETRSALEHALPQLRDGFAQAGLTLGEATVQQQMRQESQNDTVVQRRDSGMPDEVVTKSEQRQALSLVDEYA